MKKHLLTSCAAILLTGASLWSGILPAQAADEASQVLMLRRVFSAPVEAWPDVLKENRKLIDKSFFERVEQRIKWSIDNGQVEDAVRFAYVGDLAGKIANRKTDYRMQMSMLFRKLGNYSMAMDLINNVCIMDDSNHEAAFYRASLLQDAGNNIEAYPVYEKLYKENYRRAECSYRLALLDLERTDIEKARDRLKECIKLDSKHTAARQQLDKIEQALAKATFIPQTNGSGIPVGGMKGMPIKTSDPSKALALSSEADAALKSGSVSKAKELYDQALKLDANSVQALTGSGIVAYREGNIDAAIVSFSAAAEKTPGGNADLENYLGSCFERRYDKSGNASDIQEACSHFRKCLQLNPNHELAKMALERASQKMK